MNASPRRPGRVGRSAREDRPTTVEAGVFTGPVLRGAEIRGRAFTGLRVAVLAPGREAAWLVPEIARTAASVKVFQEEPDWLVPLPVPLPGPLAPLAARAHLRLAVKDPWLRRQLTPDARFNHRRPWVDGRYYAVLQEPHCTLYVWPVYAVVPHGLRTAEGIEHRVDLIVVGAESVFAPALLNATATSTPTAPTDREDLPA